MALAPRCEQLLRVGVVRDYVGLFMELSLARACVRLRATFNADDRSTHYGGGAKV